MGWGIAALSGLSGIAQAAGSLYAAKKSASAAKQINQQQIEYNKEAAQNAHQWEVEDLKKAGLNPILSANGGASVNAMSPIMPDTSGYGNAFTSAAETMRTFNAAQNETKLANTQSDKNQADAALAIANTDFTKGVKTQSEKEAMRQMQSNIAFNSAAAATKKAETANLYATAELNTAKKFESTQNAWNKIHQNENLDQQRDLLKKQIKYYEAEAIARGLSSFGSAAGGAAAWKAAGKAFTKKRK